MNRNENVVDLKRYQESNRQELIDDISARAFIFLRDQSEENNIPIKSVLTEHLLGIGAIVKAVEGETAMKQMIEGVLDELCS